jgi:phosphohistidine phosphatase SixA
MHISILRHAKAVERGSWHGEDADRPLTDEGVHQSIRLLKRVRPLITATEIWTSPWLRAKQTAELAGGLWELPIREMAWLAGETFTIAERAKKLEGAVDMVLVGHEPELSELIEYLCGAHIRLKKSGLALLEGIPQHDAMHLFALVSPRIAQHLV